MVLVKALIAATMAVCKSPNTWYGRWEVGIGIQSMICKTCPLKTPEDREDGSHVDSLANRSCYWIMIWYSHLTLLVLGSS